MVKCDLVYKTVLYLLNKEQRGYMTPAEFNKVAEQVQMEIFEKYFDDLNQQLRTPSNDSEYADRIKDIRDRIQFFELVTNLNQATSATGDIIPNGWAASVTTGNEIHRIGTLEYQVTNLAPMEIQEITRKQYSEQQRSKLTKSSKNLFCYYRQGNIFYIYPSPSSSNTNYVLYYIRKPKQPTWEYSIGSLGQYVHSSGGQDFELSSIEQSEIILKILSYAGIIIRDPQIAQQAAQIVGAEDANEKS